ncbi:TIGR04206 family protein [Haloarcula sp. CBA1130]|uniref:TIGR04206 family protein n=1 Tax=unclassified Haloarcula TaxID=2624677 RepID=UPI0012465F0C|nr:MULTISPECIES: TIGR04206 family protein [unclassified Haloarcula]KAA9398138.1 TIGR04206 family protein [Haloarcula sp. CBA1129]KAA9402175.1 TIGR04206 family protein [Haloarcula sp. CBA1130]
MDHGPRRRLIAVVVAGLVPWTVVLIGAELTLVFSFGLFNTNPPELLSVYSYFIRFTGALPQFIESWGSGVLLYAFALASAVVGVVWREDVRITALALAGAGLTQIPVFFGFNRRLNYVAVPVGSIVLLAVVWWYYLPAIWGDTATR